MTRIRIGAVLCLVALLTGCAVPPVVTTPTMETAPVIATDPATQPTTTAQTQPPSTQTEATAPPTSTPPSTQPPAQPEKKLIVIDPGHQAKANYGKEPVGPGAAELKTKVSSGTQGVSTGLPEYKLNLSVSLKLQAILEARGYEVVMIRTTHHVDISNAERAAVANDLGADAFIRIHANGAENPETNGMITICQTANNPYNSALYEACKALSTLVLEEMAAVTGAKALYVWETDTMSGINWCAVPVTIVEMGFLSCPWEDALLSTEDYQQKIAEGIANGIDAYFES